VNANYKAGYQSKSLTGFAQGKVSGFQAAGVVNINAGYAEGIRVAGVYNAGKDLDGMQAAGVMNVNLGYVHGMQAAGVLNATLDTVEGMQAAGVMNLNLRKQQGASVAGVINVALADVEGAQIASLVNIARNINGVQIGLVNISDSCTGVPVGLLSFSRTGYHKIELFGDEVIQTQLAFRTGVQRFHNIFTAGIDMTRRDDRIWCFGYGIGTTHSIGAKWKFTADGISQVILKGGHIDEAPQMISLFTGFERQLGKRVSLGFGPVFRMMIDVSEPQGESVAIIDRFVPYSIYSTSFDNGGTMHLWVGGKLSLKFF
jgi:hypothetical protein